MAAVLILMALRAAPVRADAAAAEVLIQQGLKLRREGKPDEALEKFRQAHEMAPSSRTYGQMGLVEATLKRWTDSETHLSVALSNPDDAWVSKNRAFLDQALAVCRQHVGELVITGPAGVEVSVGGTPAGTLPAVPALRVAEGEVEVTASATGYEPFAQKVTIRPKSRAALDITMTRLPIADATGTGTESKGQKVDLPPPPPPPPQDADESHWRGWTALGLGVAGAGALAVGITWIAIDDTCPDGERHQGYNGTSMSYYFYCQTGTGQSVVRSGTYETKTRGEIMTGVGAAALIAGAIVLFTGPSKSPSVALAASPSAVWLVGRF